MKESDIVIPKETIEVKLAMRVAELEAERDRWEAAFNSERGGMLNVQAERDRYMDALQKIAKGSYSGASFVAQKALEETT